MALQPADLGKNAFMAAARATVTSFTTGLTKCGNFRDLSD